MSKRKKPADRKTAPLDAEAVTWPPFFERMGLRMDGSRPRPSLRDVEQAVGFWRTLPERMRHEDWPGGASAAERLNRLRSWQRAAEGIIMTEAERLGLDASAIRESGDACCNLLRQRPRFADKTTPPNRIAYWPHCLGRRLAGLSADEKQAVRAAERALTRLFAKLSAPSDKKVVEPITLATALNEYNWSRPMPYTEMAVRLFKDAAKWRLVKSQYGDRLRQTKSRKLHQIRLDGLPQEILDAFAKR